MDDAAKRRAAGKAFTATNLRLLAEKVCATPPQAGPIRKYAIISTPRVGSTLLANCLAATGALGWPMEWFNARYVQEFVAILGQMSGPDFVELLVRRTASSSGVFGVNFHVYQYLEWKDRGFDILSMGFSKIYWVERADKLAQAYSYAKGLKTDLWSKEVEVAAGYPDGVPLDVTPPEVAQALLEISKDDHLRDQFPIDRHYVYEQMVGRLEGVAGEILADFGLPPVPVQVQMKRQSTAFDTNGLRAIKRYFLGGDAPAS